MREEEFAKTKQSFLLHCLVLVLIFLFLPTVSEAVIEGIPCSSEPTDMVVNYGDLVTCATNSNEEIDFYRFSGNAGETIEIWVTAPGGIPCIELTAPDETSIADCGFSSANQIFTTLWQSGTHTVKVWSGYIGGVEYTLAIERHIPPSPSATPISYGMSTNDEINPLGDSDLFFFEGATGDNVSVEVSAPGGIPCVELVAPDGERIEECATSSVNRIDTILNNTGTHTVLVRGAFNFVSTYTLSLQCLDGPCASSPILDPIGNKTVNEGELLEFTINATEPDGDDLTYSASNLPTGASFDPLTQTFSWIPDYSQAGNYPNVLFTVNDNGIPPANDSETITVTVGDVSSPPWFDIFVGPGDQGWHGISVAFDSINNRFLVVWTDGGVETLPVSLYGQLVNGDGTLFGSPILISASGAYQKVAFDSANGRFLVAFVYCGGPRPYVFGQFVNGDGTLHGNNFGISPVPPNPIPPDYEYDDASVPLLEFDTVNNKFLVIWVRNYFGSPPYNIYGQFVNPDGSLNGPVIQFTNYGTDYSVVNPDLEFNPNNAQFLLTWGNQYDGYIYGRLINADGTFYGSEFTIGNGSLPSLSFDSLNNRFIAIYNNLGPKGKLINSNGTLYGAEFEILNLGTNASIVFDTSKNKFLAVGDIYYPYLGIVGQFLNPDGSLYGTDFQILETNIVSPPFMASGSSQTGSLVVWMDASYWSSSRYDIFGGFVKLSDNGLVPVIDKILGVKEPGLIVRVIGQNFGGTQGDSVVHIGPRIFDSSSPRIKLWSDTKIRIRLPKYQCGWFQGQDYRYIRVWVTVDGVDSNKKRIKVLKPDTCP